MNFKFEAGHSITTWTKRGREGQKMTAFVHAQAKNAGRGVKKWQNSVQIVVE